MSREAAHKLLVAAKMLLADDAPPDLSTMMSKSEMPTLNNIVNSLRTIVNTLKDVEAKYKETRQSATNTAKLLTAIHVGKSPLHLGVPQRLADQAQDLTLKHLNEVLKICKNAANQIEEKALLARKDDLANYYAASMIYGPVLGQLVKSAQIQTDKAAPTFRFLQKQERETEAAVREAGIFSQLAQIAPNLIPFLKTKKIDPLTELAKPVVNETKKFTNELSKERLINEGVLGSYKYKGDKEDLRPLISLVLHGIAGESLDTAGAKLLPKAQAFAKELAKIQKDIAKEQAKQEGAL